VGFARHSASRAVARCPVEARESRPAG